MVLRGKGLWNIVEGTEQEPQELSEKALFARRKDIALTNIILTIDDTCNAAVITLRDPKEVWDKLGSMYRKVLDARIDAPLVHLQKVKMHSSERIMEYVNRITEIENKLAGVGHLVDSAEKKRVLLRGLRKEFTVTAEVIRAIELDFEDAVSRLVAAEAEREESEEEPDRADRNSALAAAPDHLKCKFCCKGGHNEDRCFFNPEISNYRPQLAKKRKDRRRKRANKGHIQDTGKACKKSIDAHDGKSLSAYVDVSFFSKVRNRQRKGQKRKKMNDPRIKGKWYIDSGASSHMCNDQNLFRSFHPNVADLAVSVGDGMQAEVTGVGSVNFISVISGRKKRIELKDVLCVPTLVCNLISVSRIAEAGLSVTFNSKEQGKSTCDVKDTRTNTLLMTGIDTKGQGLYEAVMLPSQNVSGAALVSRNTSPSTWHERLGHVSINTIRKSISMVHGVPMMQASAQATCEAC